MTGVKDIMNDWSLHIQAISVSWQPVEPMLARVGACYDEAKSLVKPNSEQGR